MNGDSLYKKLNASVNYTNSKRPIISLFNLIRDRIRNRFSSTGNNSISTTVTSENPNTVFQEGSPTTDLQQQPQLMNVSPEHLESFSVSTLSTNAAEPTISADFDNENLSTFANLIVSTTGVTTNCKFDELNIQISDLLEQNSALRIEIENVSKLNALFSKFEEKFEARLTGMSEILMNLNDQVAINNEITQFFHSVQDTKGKKKTVTESNIIKVDILKT